MEEISFKETLSVGGGEKVRPIRQEEDIEVEASEGERNEEAVEEVEMPVNILERDDRRLNCYIKREEVMFEMASYEAF